MLSSYTILQYLEFLLYFVLASDWNAPFFFSRIYWRAEYVCIVLLAMESCMQQIVELKNAAQCASLILFVGEVVLVYWPSLVIVSFNHGLITYFFYWKLIYLQHISQSDATYSCAISSMQALTRENQEVVEVIE